MVTKPHPTPPRPAGATTRRFSFLNPSYFLFPVVSGNFLYSSFERCRMRAPFRLATARLIPAVSRTVGCFILAAPYGAARRHGALASSARVRYSNVGSPPSLSPLAHRRSRAGVQGRAPSRRPPYGSCHPPPMRLSLFFSPLPPPAAAATPPPHQVRSRPAVVPFQLGYFPGQVDIWPRGAFARDASFSLSHAHCPKYRYFFSF